MIDQDQYFVDIAGETAGPFSIGDLANLYAGGTITKATLFSKPGAVTWLPVETIFPLLAAAVRTPAVAVASGSPAPAPNTASRLQRGEVICPQCRETVVPKRHAPGSFVVEVALWVLFCFPGLIYSLWRISAARRRSCPECGASL